MRYRAWNIIVTSPDFIDLKLLHSSGHIYEITVHSSVNYRRFQPCLNGIRVRTYWHHYLFDSERCKLLSPRALGLLFEFYDKNRLTVFHPHLQSRNRQKAIDRDPLIETEQGALVELWEWDVKGPYRLELKTALACALAKCCTLEALTALNLRDKYLSRISPHIFREVGQRIMRHWELLEKGDREREEREKARLEKEMKEAREKKEKEQVRKEKARRKEEIEKAARKIDKTWNLYKRRKRK